MRAAISSISSGVRGALDRGSRTRPRRAARRCRAGRRVAVRRPADGDQELVARPVAHRVVDELEVVEVDEEDADHDLRLVRTGHCPLDAVPEQHPVREPGERVVERPVGELLLQFPLLGDVPQGEHDAADGRVVPEIAGGHLDVDAGPIGARQPGAAGAGPGVPGHSACSERSVASRSAGATRSATGLASTTRPRTASADGLAYRIAAAVVHDQDDVVGVLHERPEVRLVVAPDHLLAQRHPFERERRLRGEHLESAAESEQNRLGGRHDEEPHRGPGGGWSVGTSGHANAVAKPSSSRAAAPSRSATCRSRLGSSGMSAPGPGTPAVAPSTSNTARCAEPTGTRRPTAMRTDVARSAASAGRYQVRTGRAQRALPLDGLPVSDHHSRQPHQDDQEQQGGGRRDHRRAPNLAGQRLGEERAGSDERHRHQQCDASDAHLRRRRPHRDREIGHRRAQCRETPGDVEDHPAEVVVAADRPGAVELPEAVDDVRRQEPGHAGAEQGRSTVAPARDEQAGEGRHQEDVAERVGDRRRAFLPRERGVLDVRVDEEDPAQQCQCRGDAERVEEAAPVTTTGPALDEQDEACGCERIHREVEDVGERRERSLLPEDRREHVVRGVARGEHGDGECEQPPRQWARRAVDQYPDHDRGRTAEGQRAPEHEVPCRECVERGGEGEHQDAEEDGRDARQYQHLPEVFTPRDRSPTSSKQAA